MFLDKYSKLETGMTENQITEILGHPPGYYTIKSRYIIRGGIDAPGQEPKAWWGEDCVIKVWFDSSGRAKKIHKTLPIPED